jgi:hypothetical protein
MMPLLLVLALIVAADGVSLTTPASQLAPRPERFEGAAPMPGGGAASTEGDTVAGTLLRLVGRRPPYPDPYVDYASIGPARGCAAVAGGEGGYSLEGPSGPIGLNPEARRLRVMLCSCETSAWLVIDDILVSRADSRAVSAEYRLDPRDVRELWTPLRQTPRVRRPLPTGPPIRWLGATSFAWVMPADTLFVEQRADSVFRVTLKARVR